MIMFFFARSPANQFTNTLNSVTYKIYKNSVLYKTIVQTVNFTVSYWPPSWNGVNGYISDTTYYVTDLPSILLDTTYLSADTTYEVYLAAISEGGTNSNNSFYNNTAFTSSSHFLVNSADSSHPSDFLFTIDTQGFGVGFNDGCAYFSQVNTNKVYSSDLNANLLNINEIRGSGETFLTDLDVSGNTTINTLSVSGIANFNNDTSLSSCTSLVMQEPITYSTLYGQFKRLINPVNWNINNGGSNYTYTHTGGEGYWYYIFSNTKSNDTANLMLLMYFTSSSSKTITQFNNNSSVNWNVSNSGSAPQMVIRCNYGLWTSWYIYALQFF